MANNSNCKLVSKEFTRTQDMMVFECVCGNHFETSFHKFKGRDKKQCNACGIERRAKKDRLTYEEVKNRIENGNTCKLLSKTYKGHREQLELQCECGNEYTSTLDYLTTSGKVFCDKCVKEKRSYHRQLFYDDIVKYMDKHGGDCKLISEEYINTVSPLLFKCKCGKEFKTSFAVFKIKKRKQCYECTIADYSKERRLSLESVKAFIETESGSGCKLLSNKYTNNSTFLEIECECGNVFNVGFATFQAGQQRCTTCSNVMSNGEREIQCFLKERNIEHQMEFTFDDLYYKNPLRFDFAILDGNELKYLIEYDGIQHFEPIEHFGGQEYFESVVLMDKMKNEYCKTNNINLIRVKYDENVAEVLNKNMRIN